MVVIEHRHEVSLCGVRFLATIEERAFHGVLRVKVLVPYACKE